MARTMGGKRAVGNADRLSDLPDGLIHYIMSFLTAREAVQTCLLSRRWEDLWCSMPYLTIDEQDFRPSAVASALGSEDWDDYGEEFEDDIDYSGFETFITNLLMFHSAATLDRFRFHAVCHAVSHREIKFINSWLRRGIKRCPRVVEIHSTDGCKLPLLGSSSARLNRLHLTGITLDRNFPQQLRSNCPVLDDLELKRCKLDDEFEIASSALKILTIEDCTTSNPSALTIRAPSLTHLQLFITAFVQNWHAIHLDEMPLLIKAAIRFKASTAILPCKLLFSLIYVKDLELTGLRTLDNLHIGSGTFPVFHNVRTLLLDKCDLSDNCDILESFLNNAPCLEKLTLQQCELPEVSKKSRTGGDVESTSLESQGTPSFQCPSLKCTEIKYKDDDDVQKWFDLILGIWRNLQKSNITIKKASRSYSMV